MNAIPWTLIKPRQIDVTLKSIFYHFNNRLFMGFILNWELLQILRLLRIGNVSLIVNQTPLPSI